ncbi:aminopeptidase N [Psittacicella hinzii]|uniref:Aminopeptidase N n=1 Tax=Psittacicella hinzii TaxID=2028575 RepID=A0A3A1YSI4_9GAMM|nr:aminopeptidase N [Psittacicella hinzii]RIY40178.1 aminopeptidase N [Psittacicella hinzii]
MSNKTLKRLDYQPLDFRIVNTNLEICLDLPETAVKAQFVVKRDNPQATSFTLDGQKLSLQEVKINGQVWQAYELVEHEGVDGFQSLTVDVSALEKADAFELEITNTFNLAENFSMSGIYCSEEVIVSQCEAQGFRRITFYFDRPDNLAVFTTKLIAKKDYQYLLANGNLVESGEAANGYHYAVWADPYPKPSYLFACVAGNFDVLDDKFTTKSGREVTLRLFAEPGKLEQIRFGMEALKRAMKWDEERFGLEYDLDIFMIVGVSHFNAGAMENKGLNIFNENLLIGCKNTVNDLDLERIDSVIAHEYFHNWTGDRVTCRDWFQLTLKEGLTVFRDQEYTSDTVDRTIKRISDVQVMEMHQFMEDSGPLSHPIRPDEVESQDNFYTSTVYEKGAEVIRLLHTLIGEENFQKGMRLYFERHDGKAVTCDDFVDAMADASGFDATKFRRWYSQSGTPEVKVTANYDAAKQTLDLTFTQHTAPTFDQAEKLPLVLALKTQFLSPEGQILHNLKTETGQVVPEVIVFDQEQVTYRIVDLAAKPIVVTNLDFSSPVKINQEFLTQDLAVIAAYSDNLYGKYQAYKRYYIQLFNSNLANVASGKLELDAQFTQVFQSLFALAQTQPYICANILNAMNYQSVVQDAKEPVDPIVYAELDKQIRVTLYQQFAQELKDLYQSLPFTAWKYDAHDNGVRALRRSLLSLLTVTGQNLELIQDLAQKADNYNDRLSAVIAVLCNGIGQLSNLVEQFKQQHKAHNQCMEELLGLQFAYADNMEQFLTYTQDPAFNYQKPNCNYFLLGGFRRNAKVAYSNEGIEFLKDLALRVDGFNSHVSPMYGKFFSTFYKFAEPYRSKMVQALKELAENHNISRNLSEVVTKSYKLSQTK